MLYERKKGMYIDLYEYCLLSIPTQIMHCRDSNIFFKFHSLVIYQNVVK